MSRIVLPSGRELCHQRIRDVEVCIDILNVVVVVERVEQQVEAVEITAIHYRTNPVLTNALMADYPSCEQSGFFAILRGAKIWDDFDKLGVPGIISGGITQINILVGTMIASLQAGAFTASRLPVAFSWVNADGQEAFVDALELTPPALVALNPRKQVYSVMRGAFNAVNLEDYVFALSNYRAGMEGVTAQQDDTARMALDLRPIPAGRVVTVGAYFPSVVAAAAASGSRATSTGGTAPSSVRRPSAPRGVVTTGTSIASASAADVGRATASACAA